MSLLRTAFTTFAATSQLVTATKLNHVRHVKRWVAPTLRELRRRKEKLGPEEPQPRSEFLEWNYRAELFAFGKRLNENFDMTSLRTALTHQSYINREETKQRELGVEQPDLEMTNNSKLVEKGAQLVIEYVDAFLKHSLPKVPDEGIKAISTYLTSEDMLAHISTHLGLKELVFSAEYPPSNETMAKSLLAVIGALEESSGTEKAFAFIRDFVCTQLNQKDLSELWEIKNPTEYLKQVCKDLKLTEPEPRLIGDVGKNTVLAAYQVAVYTNKKQIGQGFGEDVETAIDMASLDALRTLFGIPDNMKPFNFSLEVERLTKAKSTRRLQQ